MTSVGPPKVRGYPWADWLWKVLGDLGASPRSSKTKVLPHGILAYPYLTAHHSPVGSALLSHLVVPQHFHGSQHCGVMLFPISYGWISHMGLLGRLGQGRAKPLPGAISVSIHPVLGTRVHGPTLPTALHRFLGRLDVQDVIEEMKEEQRSLSSMEMVSVWQLLRDRSVRWQTLSVAVVSAGMQLSGIDAVSPVVLTPGHGCAD